MRDAGLPDEPLGGAYRVGKRPGSDVVDPS